MQKVNALQIFIKTAVVSGIAFFWANFTVEALKTAWHIISYSQDAAYFKVVCENCHELYDNDERRLINGSKLCEGLSFQLKKKYFSLYTTCLSTHSLIASFLALPPFLF